MPASSSFYGPTTPHCYPVSPALSHLRLMGEMGWGSRAGQESEGSRLGFHLSKQLSGEASPTLGSLESHMACPGGPGSGLLSVQVLLDRCSHGTGARSQHRVPQVESQFPGGRGQQAVSEATTGPAMLRCDPQRPQGGWVRRHRPSAGKVLAGERPRMERRSCFTDTSTRAFAGPVRGSTQSLGKALSSSILWS